VKLKLHLLAVSIYTMWDICQPLHKIAPHRRWTQRLDIILVLLLIMLYIAFITITQQQRGQKMWPCDLIKLNS